MIRWITDRLGTAPAADVDAAPGLRLLDVRDLVDKHGNSVDVVRAKLEQGARWLRDGHAVVIGCDYGISRSNAIAAGVLALGAGLGFVEAVRRVMAATGEHDIKVEPLNVVLRALEPQATVRPSAGMPVVIVTGGSGFIGRRVTERLVSKGCAVFAPTRAEIDLGAGAGLLDLLVKETGADTLVHLANPRVFASNRAVGDILAMLRNVIDVCRENGLQLIFRSSWEIYSGYASPCLRAGEALPPLPKGPYGEAKWLAEELIGHHRRVHGLACGVLRSSPLYGPDCDRPRFIRTFIEKARAGQTLFTHRYRNGPPRLDLMHVQDFVTAVAAAVERRLDGEVNLGTGELHGTDEIAARIRDWFGASSSVESVAVDEDAACIAMDTARAARLLDWQPTVRFDDGLVELLEQGGRQ